MTSAAFLYWHAPASIKLGQGRHCEPQNGAAECLLAPQLPATYSTRHGSLIPKGYIPWVLSSLSEDQYAFLLTSRLTDLSSGAPVGRVQDWVLDGPAWTRVRGAYRFCQAGMKKHRKREILEAWMQTPHPLLDNATPLAILHDPRLDPLLWQILERR